MQSEKFCCLLKASISFVSWAADNNTEVGKSSIGRNIIASSGRPKKNQFERYLFDAFFSKMMPGEPAQVPPQDHDLKVASGINHLFTINISRSSPRHRDDLYQCPGLLGEMRYSRMSLPMRCFISSNLISR